jgi:hypothetical protein
VLPLAGEVLVREGQRVSPADIVAQADQPGRVQPVNVAQVLGLSPAEVPGTMTKAVGESVAAGEVMARTKGLWGLWRTECCSPVTGTIASVSPLTGQVLIEEPPVPVTVSAFLAGDVTSLVPGRGAVIQAGGAYVQGVFGQGGEAWGELVVAVASGEDTLTEDELTADQAGKIVVGGATVGQQAWAAARRLGIVGIITGGFEAENLAGVQATGPVDEEGEAVPVGPVLFVMGGFGRIPIDPDLWALLNEREGEMASLDGTTQVRAGVIRPELFIPYPAPDRREAAVDDKPAVIGSNVRLTGGSTCGQIGRLVDLPAGPHAFAGEIRALAAEVELTGGERVMVPRVNVERI